MALWGKTDQTGSRPKWLEKINIPEGTDIVFVDRTESQQPANRARGLRSPGWWLYRSWTNDDGSVQHEAELLVAMDVTAGAAGDANDDLIVVDRTITITAQPQDSEAVSGSAVSFSVTATVSPTASLAYLWQVSTNGGDTWSTASGTNNAATYNIADNTGLDGNQYRVRLTATGTPVVFSNAATLIEAA